MLGVVLGVASGQHIIVSTDSDGILGINLGVGPSATITSTYLVGGGGRTYQAISVNMRHGEIYFGRLLNNSWTLCR